MRTACWTPLCPAASVPASLPPHAPTDDQFLSFSGCRPWIFLCVEEERNYSLVLGGGRKVCVLCQEGRLWSGCGCVPKNNVAPGWCRNGMRGQREHGKAALTELMVITCETIVKQWCNTALRWANEVPFWHLRRPMPQHGRNCPGWRR